MEDMEDLDLTVLIYGTIRKVNILNLIISLENFLIPINYLMISLENFLIPIINQNSYIADVANCENFAKHIILSAQIIDTHSLI